MQGRSTFPNRNFADHLPRPSDSACLAQLILYPGIFNKYKPGDLAFTTRIWIYVVQSNWAARSKKADLKMKNGANNRPALNVAISCLADLGGCQERRFEVDPAGCLLLERGDQAGCLRLEFSLNLLY